METKIEVNLSLLENMAEAANILFNILIEKDLTDEDLPLLENVQQLLLDGNKILKKNIDDNKKPFNKISFN
jgi:hypothetical protein